MALPVTITGVGLDIATVGPLKSSAGNFYFFGKDASVATTLQCCKATDPTDAWSLVANDATFATGIADIAAFQVGDVVHIVVADGTDSRSCNYKYRTFNLATDSFVLSETIATGLDIRVGGFDPPHCSIVVRSGGEVVVFASTPFVSGYRRTGYFRRTGVNTWDGPTDVGSGGGFSYLWPIAIMGDSDEVHFCYSAGLEHFSQCALNSSNVLQTITEAPYDDACAEDGISFVKDGVRKCLAASSRGVPKVVYFDSGDTPTLNVFYLGDSVQSARLAVDLDGTAYVILHKTDNKYYYRSTDDGGAHWSAEVFICNATNSGQMANTSRFSKLYPDLTDVVLPFVYLDSTALKYNHKTVRSILLQGSVAFFGNSQLSAIGLGGDFTAPLEDPFRLRFSILNEGETLEAAAWQLYVSKNGGAYHAVTTTSDDARSVNAGSSPDETQILIPRLSIPA